MVAATKKILCWGWVIPGELDGCGWPTTNEDAINSRDIN